MGNYFGEAISFNMNSIYFKELAQQGKVHLKNGTFINCCIIIKKKINNEGIEKIANIEVTSDTHYFENDIPFETPAGRKKKKTNEKQQLKLFATKMMETNRTPVGNTTFKKLAVKLLNEALFIISTVMLADSFVFRNRQLPLKLIVIGHTFTILHLENNYKK